MEFIAFQLFGVSPAP